VPAGLFSLEGFERFLDEHFARRSIPNHFLEMPRALRITAHDLDRGVPVVFGGPGFTHVPVSRACIASMATAPLFSPVRIGQSHYFNPAPIQVPHVDLAIENGAEVVVVINAMVPIRASRVPTGHGDGTSLRDKGAMWVANQGNRIKLHSQLHASIERVKQSGRAAPRIVLVEPEPFNGDLFLHNPASFGARRGVLEYAYRYTLEQLRREVSVGNLPSQETGWKAKLSGGQG
jgi:predicted acylesterase/phospholipase RssA